MIDLCFTAFAKTQRNWMLTMSSIFKLSHNTKIPFMNRYLYNQWIQIDESIKGDASQNRYNITFDGNIDVLYNFQRLFLYWLLPENRIKMTISKMLAYRSWARRIIILENKISVNWNLQKRWDQEGPLMYEFRRPCMFSENHQWTYHGIVANLSF